MIELEQELLDLLHDVGRPEDRLKEYLILELYRRRQISSGRAAELLKMERYEFIRFASRSGISFFDLDEREFKSEIDAARRIG
jgi:predicted HTH domain antitoxin